MDRSHHRVVDAAFEKLYLVLRVCGWMGCSARTQRTPTVPTLASGDMMPSRTKFPPGAMFTRMRPAPPPPPPVTHSAIRAVGGRDQTCRPVAAVTVISVVAFTPPRRESLIAHLGRLARRHRKSRRHHSPPMQRRCSRSQWAPRVEWPPPEASTRGPSELVFSSEGRGAASATIGTVAFDRSTSAAASTASSSAWLRPRSGGRCKQPRRRRSTGAIQVVSPLV